MRECYPQTHLTNQPRGHVTSQRRYISLSQDLSIPNLVGYWLFCGYYNRGLRRSKLADPSIILFLIFFVKENFEIIKF